MADSFANDGGTAVRFEIEAVKGLDVKSFSETANEDELLLDHDSTFTVAGVERVGATWHVKMKQVAT